MKSAAARHCVPIFICLLLGLAPRSLLAQFKFFVPEMRMGQDCNYLGTHFEEWSDPFGSGDKFKMGEFKLDWDHQKNIAERIIFLDDNGNEVSRRTMIMDSDNKYAIEHYWEDKNGAAWDTTDESVRSYLIKPDQNTSERIYQRYHPQTKWYDNSKRREYKDPVLPWTVISRYNYSGGSWMITSMDSLMYGTNGKLLQEIEYYWNQSKNQLDFAQMYRYHYSTTSQTDTVLKYRLGTDDSLYCIEMVYASTYSRDGLEWKESQTYALTETDTTWTGTLAQGIDPCGNLIVDYNKSNPNRPVKKVWTVSDNPQTSLEMDTLVETRYDTLSSTNNRKGYKYYVIKSIEKDSILTGITRQTNVLNGQKVKVFPNPASPNSKLYMETNLHDPTMQTLYFTLLHASGHLAHSGDMEVNDQGLASLRLPELPRGYYVLRIRAKDHSMAVNQVLLIH